MVNKNKPNDSILIAYRKDLLPRIVVKDPVVHQTWEHGKFTSYLICIKTNHPAFHLHMSAVRRRYSELVWLSKILKSNHHHLNFPTIPPKTVLKERFDPNFMTERAKLIENYLNELLVTDTILADAAFHLFLQTDLTKEEIEEYFAGRLTEEFVDTAWKNVGHVHTSSYVVNINTVPCEPQEIVMNEEDLRLSAQRLSLSSDSYEEIGSDQHAAAAQRPHLSAVAEITAQPVADTSLLNVSKSENGSTKLLDSSDFEASIDKRDVMKLIPANDSS